MKYKNIINIKPLNNSNIIHNTTKINKLPDLSKINDYVTKSTNPFYFYMRFKKPLKIIEPKSNLMDTTLLLTTKQRARIKELKEKVKKIQKEKLKSYVRTTNNIVSYKNMLPVQVWRKCENTYEKLKHKYGKILKMKEEKYKHHLYEIDNIQKKQILSNKLGRKEIFFNKKNKVMKPNINLTMRNIENEKNENYINKQHLNNSVKYPKFNYNNFERCLSTICIRNKFKNQGLNKFINATEKKSFVFI